MRASLEKICTTLRQLYYPPCIGGSQSPSRASEQRGQSLQYLATILRSLNHLSVYIFKQSYFIQSNPTSCLSLTYPALHPSIHPINCQLSLTESNRNKTLFVACVLTWCLLARIQYPSHLRSEPLCACHYEQNSFLTFFIPASLSIRIRNKSTDGQDGNGVFLLLLPPSPRSCLKRKEKEKEMGRSYIVHPPIDSAQLNSTNLLARLEGGPSHKYG